MSGGAPWSVKGIDPKAREVAKEHARRSGMTLGEWLNHVILDDGAGEGEPLVGGGEGPELARIAQALDRITDRIEASETRTGLAINGVEHSIRQALARIETTEREQNAMVARLEGALADNSAQTHDVVERLRRLESDVGPRSDEALRALEGRVAQAQPEMVVERVLERLGARLAEAEARTTAALEDLRGSLARLDQRVWSVEHGSGEQAERKFEALGQVLTHRVEAVRAEVAQRLQASAGGAAVEARLAEMAKHVAAAEARSTKAVEAIGHQVLAMAEAVSRKLTEVDDRGAVAIDQVGAEVARIAGAVELRLARGEQAQAQAFQRLTAEFARMSEDLSARLPATPPAAPEPPAAEPPEAAPPPPSTASGPSLEDAGEPTFAVLGPPPEPEPESELPPVAAATFGPELFSRAEVASEPAVATDAPEAETVTAAWRRLDAPDTLPSFAPLEDADADLFEAPGAPGTSPLSTREVIEQARAAARAKREDGAPDVEAKPKPARSPGGLFSVFTRPRRENSTLQTALMIAGGAAFFSVSAAGLTLLQGASSKEAPTEAADATLSQTPRAAMALTNLISNGGAAQPAPSFPQVYADVQAGAPGAVDTLKAMAAQGHAEAQLYLGELYDQGGAGLPRDPVEARRLTTLAAETGLPKAMHNLGVYLFQGEGGPADATGAAEWFRRAAEQGVVESQYNLGLLYQAGSGVAQDPAQARVWFQRAAAHGDAAARQALAQMAPPPAPKAAPRPPRALARETPPRAATVRPATVTPTASASPNVQQAQVILTRLGYYQGPADGHANEAYKVALFKYQQDQRDQAQGPRPYAAER